jgi:hypothetical protein
MQTWVTVAVVACALAFVALRAWRKFKKVSEQKCGSCPVARAGQVAESRSGTSPGV